MATGDRGAVLRNAALDLAAVTSFALTLWLAYADKASSATVTALMAVGFAALRYLPLIDTIEAFGLKAKLRETVREADDVLGNLRTTTAAASRLAYFQLAYSGRMASPTWKDKLDLLAQMDASLTTVGVDPEDAASMKAPLMRFAVADIYYLVSHVVAERLEHHRKRLQAEQDGLFKGQPVDPNNADFLRIQSEKQTLRGMPGLGYDLMDHPMIPTIGAFIMEGFHQSGLPKVDIAKVEKLIKRWSDIAQMTWDTKMVSGDALPLVEAHSPEARQTFLNQAWGEE